MADTTIKRLRTDALLSRYSDGFGYGDGKMLEVGFHAMPAVTAAVAGPVGRELFREDDWRPTGLFEVNPKGMYVVGRRESGYSSWGRRGIYYIESLDELDENLEPVLKAGVTHNTPAVIISNAWTMRDGSVIFSMDTTPVQVCHGYFDATGDFQANKLFDLYNSGSLALAFSMVYQAPHGTVCIAEYGDSPGGRTIYRADSPAEPYAEVLSLDYDRHFHGISYHTGTGRWIVTRGDGSGSGVFYSEDDGLTWHVLCGHEQGRTSFQDVGLLDVGDPEWMITGSDSSDGINRLNVLTGQWQQIWFDADGRANKPYVFSLVRHKGITYGTTVDYSGGDRNNVLAASADHKNWSIIHRWGDSSETVIAGVFEDRLLLRYSPGSAGVFMAAVDALERLYNVDGIVLDGAYKNELSEQASRFVGSDLAGFSGLHRVGIVESGYHGDYSLKYANNGDIIIDTPVVACNVGDYVSGSVVLRGRSQEATTVRLRSAGGNLGGDIIRMGPLRDEPMVFVVHPRNEHNGYSLRIKIAGDDCECYIDALQLVVNGVAHTWVPGGVDRPADKYQAMVNAGNQWTNIFCIRPGLWSHLLAAGGNVLEIRRWSADDANYARLIWRASSNTFLLHRFGNGSPIPPVESGPSRFYRNSTIWFAVRFDGVSARLSVANGGLFDHRAHAPLGAIEGAAITVKYGDGTPMPMDLLHDWWLNEALSDAEIGQAIQQYIGLAAVDVSEGGGSVSSFDEQALDQFREVLQLEQQRLVKAAKVTLNKAVQSKDTGEIVYYDDDGQTPLVRHMPVDGEAKITRDVV